MKRVSPKKNYDLCLVIKGYYEARYIPLMTEHVDFSCY